MDGPEVKPEERPRLGLWANCVLLIYTTVALAVLLGVANLIIFDHNIRWDLTPGGQCSLSRFDKRVLSGLKHNVRVMAFVRTEDASYLRLADLLFQVASYAPRVTYQVIDVNRAPGLSRQYGVSIYGQVVVESQGRRRDFDNARADLLIPAILEVSRVTKKKIYFTVAHGERDLFNTDRNRGFSEFRNYLEQANYEIDNVSLFVGGVPSDCSVLVSLAPRKNFMPQELAAIAKYLASGGKYIVFLDPYGSPNLASFLQKYYMHFAERVVVDPAYRLTAGESLTMQMPLFSKTDPITRSMVGAAVFSMLRGVAISGKPGDKGPDGLVMFRGGSFLRSSHQSWASGDPKALATGITEFKPGRDIRGPIQAGSEVDFAVKGDMNVPVQQMTRIVGFGSSAFASNQFIGMLGNRDLAVSAVNELAGDEILIASRERLNKGEAAAFYVTNAQATRSFYLGAIAEPSVLFLIGIAVFVRRRFFA